MARKSKKKAVYKKDPKLSKKIKFLEKLVSLSLKAADGTHAEIDAIFFSQADRLSSEIRKLKENQ